VVGDGEREAAGHFVLHQFAENRDERQVTFRYGFKEPVFFQESWMLGMANKRQMGVEDERQITDGHGRTKTKVFWR